MKQRKILDVVLDCMDKGFKPEQTQALLKDLREKGLLIEPKPKKRDTFFEEPHEERSNEISAARWEQLEYDYLRNTRGWE